MRFVTPFLSAAAALFFVAAPLPALADSCTDRIKALYDGGPLDPFVQPPYRFETTATSADGTVLYESETVFDTPLRVMSGIKGQTLVLSIGQKTWISASSGGLWTESPNLNPQNIEAFHMITRDQLASNVRDAVCPGTVQLMGREMIRYDFHNTDRPEQSTGRDILRCPIHRLDRSGNKPADAVARNRQFRPLPTGARYRYADFSL